ncbi:MAG: hypothetical protein PUB18_00180 [bacterium]|nr:hypothetical protein [bacterium]
MKIIAQKTDALNNEEFLNNIKEHDFIDAISLNIALTQDNRILAYNIRANSESIINTIEESTLEQLDNYEIELLNDALSNINQKKIKKDIYINIVPFRTGPLTNENIEFVTNRMNLYIDLLKEILEKYPNLKIKVHSINRSILTIAKTKLKNYRLGYVIHDRDLNFTDVDYYVITMNAFDDSIIDLLLNRNKEVILYISSDYYLSYIYQHYLGEKSTPHLNQTLQRLGIMTNYPEIVNQVLKTSN